MTLTAISFRQPDLARRIEELSPDLVDTLPFGVIRTDRRGKILIYSAVEARQSGRKKRPTVGLNLFSEVAPCMDAPGMRGRIDTAIETGSVDFEIGWVGDFDDPDGEILIRVQSASDGGLWFFMNRDVS